MTDAAYVRIYFLTRDGEIEVRCHFFAEDFTTYFSTRPYTPINDDPRVNTVLDKKDDFVLGLELGDNGDGSMLITWMVDGVKICSQPANYGKFLLSTTQELDLLIDASPGDVTMDWWRFADLLKWD